ncbi:MAG: tRNA glutamyl-Q(34) synthetase GluQRS [Albidovulum sp.]
MRTRFAPSPTGPLHLGHAYSAILAYDLAQAAGGEFVLRIEDTDLARCRPEWEALIYEDLNWLGLTWGAPVWRQSDNLARYDAALDQLAGAGLIYPCKCTRADIRAALAAPQEGVESGEGVYPGLCRHRNMDDRQTGDALRLDMAKALASLSGLGGFTELGSKKFGTYALDSALLLKGHGDAVLGRKAQGYISYVLASVIDDAAQGISHVIRGDDLFEITFLQVLLQNLLGLPTPAYHHHRLIRDDAGKRLAKRDDARAIRLFRDEGASPADIRRMVGLL